MSIEEKDGDTVLVAVYGSLKEGKGNHRLLKDSKFVDTGITVNSYTMVSFTSFPGIIKNDTSGHNVFVEVYEVDQPTFSRLDRLEGYPSFYNREEVTIDLNSGGTTRAYIYSLNCDGRDLPKVSPNEFGILIW